MQESSLDLEPTVSFVIPVMDEVETVGELYSRICEVMKRVSVASGFEIVFVDDGSSDGTWQRLAAISKDAPHMRALRLRRNFGKAVALQVGIDSSGGDVIITMDGDLQDDPNEIPRFIDQIDQGFDVVSGWKRVRHDPVGKTLPSKLFNAVTRRVSGVPIHDFNCGFKAYRREVFQTINLYGELHRFVPVLAGALGYRIGEIEVQHHPRRHGRSKYGLWRLFKGFIDLLTVVTITRFDSKPGHLFGGVGLAFLGLGVFFGGWLTIEWLFGHAIGQRPLLLLSVLLNLVGVQFLLFGMLAELMIGQRDRRPRADMLAEVVGADK